MPRRYEPDCAVWEITLRCNLSCSHCGSSAGPQRSAELSTKEALDLVDQLADIGTDMVSLMGGEPLVREDWRDIGLRCLDNGMETAVVSNGLLVKKELGKLREIEPRVVGLSLDGLEETHDSIRGKKGAYRRVMEAADVLREASVETTFITTVSKLNFSQLPALRDIIADRGAAWQVQVAMPIGRFKEELLIDPEEFYALCGFIFNTRKELGTERLPIAGGHCIGYDSYLNPRISAWTGCSAGISTLGIASDGGIRGCMSIPEPGTCGSIREEPLRDIWDNDDNFPYTRGFSEEILGKNCKGCSSGTICKGGCSSMSYSLTGEFNNNPYCSARLERDLYSQGFIGRKLIGVADWVRRKQADISKRK